MLRVGLTITYGTNQTYNEFYSHNAQYDDFEEEYQNNKKSTKSSSQQSSALVRVRAQVIDEGKRQKDYHMLIMTLTMKGS
mmetsp:Transcript_21549/g.24932  ORF Transcript_21549/g.24932 Transcript_21549/m.24932 type:complete len:80 (-) Transcript_21549:64-303(-)